MARLAALAGLLVLLAGCSAQQVYGGLQARERNLCAEGPPQQYEDCMARTAMSYREYAGLPDL